MPTVMEFEPPAPWWNSETQRLCIVVAFAFTGIFSFVAFVVTVYFYLPFLAIAMWANAVLQARLWLRNRATS